MKQTGAKRGDGKNGRASDAVRPEAEMKGGESGGMASYVLNMS